MTEPANPDTAEFQPQLSDYLHVGLTLLAFAIVLLLITAYVEPLPLAKEFLIAPIFGMTILTGIVWLLMVLARNLFILKGLVSAEYYVSYSKNTPPEWIERPARTFNNLLQLPVLFYVACLLIIFMDRVTETNLVLAWIFVASRVLHAAIYILINKVKYRFTAWMTGCLALIFLWADVWDMAT